MTARRYQPASQRDSGVHAGQTADGGLVMRMYVDRWEWLVPLVTSYGADVRVEEPAELRQAIVAHLRKALDVYRHTDKIDLDASSGPEFRDSLLPTRQPRGRCPGRCFRCGAGGARIRRRRVAP